MQIAAGLSIQPSMLRDWRAMFKGIPVSPPVGTNLAAERARLKRELERVKRERDLF
jgi:transposase-like protein